MEPGELFLLIKIIRGLRETKPLSILLVLLAFLILIFIAIFRLYISIGLVGLLIFLITSVIFNKSLHKKLGIVGFILSILLSAGIFYGVNYFQIVNSMKEAEELAESKSLENYTAAISLLSSAREKAYTGSLKNKVSAKLTEYQKQQQLLQDELNYSLGLEEFNNKRWKGAMEKLGMVSSVSPFYQDAQDKIKEAYKNTLSVEGTVLSNSKPAEEIKVKLCGGDKRPSPLSFLGSLECELEKNASSDQDGKYYFYDVPPGDYTILYKELGEFYWHPMEFDITIKESAVTKVRPIIIEKED